MRFFFKFFLNHSTIYAADTDILIFLEKFNRIVELVILLHKKPILCIQSLKLLKLLEIKLDFLLYLKLREFSVFRNFKYCPAFTYGTELTF
jgi:hypothetical protein